MISTLIVLMLTVTTVYFSRKLCKYPSWNKLAVLMIVGVILGAVLDLICGYSLSWYYYVHHTWWSNGYFGYVYPCWGMNMIITVCLYQIISQKFKNWSWKLALMLFLGLFEEVMGLVRNSWKYEANVFLVLLGWFGLILTCVLIKHFIDWIFSSGDIEIREEAKIRALK